MPIAQLAYEQILKESGQLVLTIRAGNEAEPNKEFPIVLLCNEEDRDFSEETVRQLKGLVGDTVIHLAQVPLENTLRTAQIIIEAPPTIFFAGIVSKIEDSPIDTLIKDLSKLLRLLPITSFRNKLPVFSTGHVPAYVDYSSVLIISPTKRLPADVAALIAFTREQRLLENKEQQEERIKAEKRIETNLATYVDSATEILKKRENAYYRIGLFFQFSGLLALVVGVVFGYSNLSQIDLKADFKMEQAIFLSIKSLVLVGLLVGCAKYSFDLGKSYTNEGLKNADRLHAIAFGKFYLQAFGHKAEWADVKEVFQHWNMDKTSNFATLDANGFDPKTIENLTNLARALRNPDVKEEKKEFTAESK